MNVDLSEVIRSFSLFLGVNESVGQILLATAFVYLILAIWGLSRLFVLKEKSESRDEYSQLSEDIIELSKDEEVSEADDVISIEIEEPLQPESLPAAPVVEEAPQPLSTRLTKTRTGFFDKLRSVFSSKPKLDPEMLEELEYLLVTSDLGVKTVTKLIDGVKESLQKGDEVTEESLIEQLKSKLHSILGERIVEPLEELHPGRETPYIVMLVGVNGVGKTTTCAKLAARLQARGLKVLLVAADTFRAAAVEQLKSWGARLHVPVLTGPEGSKPQAVVFDAMVEAKNNRYDVVLIDTAGRLHTKTSLMQELEGVRNTVVRHFQEGPQESILVVDGSTGQNALNQAREFNEAVKLSGLVVTKLDGTPKGGIVVAIKEELGIPVRFIGVGESHQDLRPFDAHEFIEALFDRSIASSDDKVSAHAETRRRRRRGADAASDLSVS